MDNFPEWLRQLFVFILGLEFGSFANVCIHRWPRSGSVITPRRSHCPWCSSAISWRDNLPIVSYVFLGGRCRTCRSPISVRYPVVELSIAVLWLWCYRHFGSPATMVEVVFMGTLFSVLFVTVVTTMTDIDFRVIPDEASVSMIVIGLTTAVANPLLGSNWNERLAGSLLGIVVGGGIVWLAGYGGELLFKKEAMGGGDVKLVAAFGSALGWQGAVGILFLGSFLGGLAAILGLLTGRLRRHQYIPFGPFLNLAAIFVSACAGSEGKMIQSVFLFNSM